MVSCNAFTQGEDGDCNEPIIQPAEETEYLVSFRYDWNLKSADAFAQEVKQVTLYLIASDGTVAWKGTERGEALAEEGFVMRVDVEPGQYDLLAWCTTNDLDGFTLGDGVRQEQLTCTLRRSTNELGEAVIDQDLDDLYYGHRTSVVFRDEPGVQTEELPLMKDTNRVRVSLQHASGEAIDENQFKITITAADGGMDYENNLVDDQLLTYNPWHMSAGTAEVADQSATGINVWLAEFHMGRLVKGDDVRITVVNQETGATVFSVPLIDYALLMKGYERADMDDQEYLDRQDEYNLTFFLDNNNRWISTSILINSWRLVLVDGQLK
jgi:hypothetical protein